MKRRQFIGKGMVATAAVVGASALKATGKEAPKKEWYELRTYELKGNQDVTHNYLSKALIPALNRLGVKRVGVFTELGKSDPPMLYLLVAYPSLESLGTINAALKNDKEFVDAATTYNHLPVDQPAYFSQKSSLMIAFDGMPVMQPTDTTSKRIFEMRTYMGYSEDAVQRKLGMFNMEEFPIFYRTKLNPLFFGEVLIGPQLPCLTYMIWFKNMEERDAAWKAFGADADWQRIFKAPEYANTVSKIYKIFLEPTAYSQV